MRVFISYSRNDTERLKNVRHEMEKAFARWLNTGALKQPELLVDSSTDMEPGESWRKKIRDAIEKCNVFVALWTARAAASDWVQYEMAMADALNKRLVVFADPSAPTLPRPLGKYQVVTLEDDVTASRLGSDRALRVFLGYAREDFDEVNSISDLLKKAGFEPWLDRDNLVAGQNWAKAVDAAIKSSDVFLAFLSTNAVSKRGYFQKELRTALDRMDELATEERFLIPVRLERCDVPASLETLHWVDYFLPAGEQALVDSLQSIASEIVTKDRED
jgi:hypothetical protein